MCVIPAGSGKTLIAVMLIKEIAEKLQEKSTKKLIFFLAPKVELAKQVALQCSNLGLWHPAH